MRGEERLPARDLLRLQRAAGNRAVARLADGAQAEASAQHDAARRTSSAGAAGGPGWSASAGSTESALIGVPSRWRRAVRRGLNPLLDRVPHATLRLGVGRLRSEQPSFRVGVWSGLLGAVVAGAAISPWAGIPTAVFLAGTAITVTFLVVVLLLHRLISYTLQLTVLTGALLFALTMRLELLSVLDVAVVALATAQALGRFGCAMAGCCHGRPSWWGHRYGPPHVRLGFPPRLVGVRLLPVQLLESGYCAGLAVVSALLIVAGAPAGAAFGTHVIAYAVGRFGFEWLRGDADRPWLHGLSQAQWTSLALAAAALALQAAGVLPLLALHWALGAALFAAAAWRLVRWRGGIPFGERLAEVRVWDEVALGLYGVASRPEPRAFEASGPASPPRALVTETTYGLRVSLARASGPAGPAWTYGISQVGSPLGWPDARRVAELILELRHPSDAGLLLRRPNALHFLVVPPPGAGAESSEAATPQLEAAP